MLKVGFNADEIGKVGIRNFLFDVATKCINLAIYAVENDISNFNGIPSLYLIIAI
jgi:hypothetical protein